MHRSRSPPPTQDRYRWNSASGATTISFISSVPANSSHRSPSRSLGTPPQWDSAKFPAAVTQTIPESMAQAAAREAGEVPSNGPLRYPTENETMSTSSSIRYCTTRNRSPSKATRCRSAPGATSWTISAAAVPWDVPPLMVPSLRNETASTACGRSEPSSERYPANPRSTTAIVMPSPMRPLRCQESAPTTAALRPSSIAYGRSAQVNPPPPRRASTSSTGPLVKVASASRVKAPVGVTHPSTSRPG